MYLILNEQNIIIGTSAKLISNKECMERKLRLVFINKNEFKPSLLGSKIEKKT